MDLVELSFARVSCFPRSGCYDWPRSFARTPMSDPTISSTSVAITTTHDTGTDGLVPRRRTLSGFAEEISGRPGVGLPTLEPWTRLQVETRNTLYEITLLDPWTGSVSIQGGRFFASQMPALLCGSSFGGSLLKLRWIGSGMRMELVSDGRKVVTSPVRQITVLEPEPLPGPF